MATVVLLLEMSPPLGLLDGGAHRGSDRVGVHDDHALGVARRPTAGLDEGALRAQEALLVGVEDGHQRHLGDVEALAQQVDANEHVEVALAQLADEFDPLQGLDVGMQVTHPYAQGVVIFGEILGHALGQGGDQHCLTAVGAEADLLEQIVHLGGRRAHLDARVEQPGRADDLLHHLAAGLLQLVGAGGGGDIDHLVDAGDELVEAQGAVVQRRRQAEAVVDQGLLARAVAVVHAVELADGDMALVDEEQIVGREIVEQVGGRRPLGLAGEVAAVVFDAVAVAELVDHLQVEHGALLETLRLEQPLVAVKLLEALAQFVLDGAAGGLQAVLRGDEVAAGEDGVLLDLLHHDAAQGVDHRQSLHRVAKELDAQGAVLLVHREDVEDIAAHAEGAAVKGHVVTLVLHEDQAALHVLHRVVLADAEKEVHVAVLVGGAEAVDARHRGDDEHVAAGEQRARRRVAHLVDGLVDRRVLFDIAVRLGDIGLRLIVVVVGDEIFHGVMGEELLELGEELRRQGLVGGDDQGRALHLGDHLGHGKGLARAGDAEQHLAAAAGANPGGQPPHRLGLVAGGGEGGNECEGKIHSRRSVEANPPIVAKAARLRHPQGGRRRKKRVSPPRPRRCTFPGSS